MQRLVHINTGFQERTHDIGAALAHSEKQRSESGIKRETEIGAGLDQGFDHLGVPFGSGPHEGRLTVPLQRVGIGAIGEQGFHGFEASRARRSHQDRLTSGTRGVGVGPSVQQEFHQGGVSVGTSERERGHAVSVHGVHVGARSYE